MTTHNDAPTLDDLDREYEQDAGARPNGAAGPALPPLDLIDSTTLDGIEVPTRRWLVRDWIPWGYVTALYGDGGLGKTLLAQMLATAAAIGQPWLGIPTAGPLRVLALLCEDDADELHRRQADINRLYDCGFADLGNIRWLPRIGNDNLLMTFAPDGSGMVTGFYEQLLAAARDFKAQVIVVDTAADTFGGNENIRPQVRQYVQAALGRLAREVDGTALLCAHPSVAGIRSGEGTGGSTAWNNAVRSRLYLVRPAPDADDGEFAAPDETARVLSRKKANYASTGESITLRWTDGVFEVEGGTAIDSSTGGNLGRMVRQKAERVFLELLDKVRAEGRYVSDSPQAAKLYAPKMFAGRPDRDGLKRGDFAKAMEALFAAGKIRMGTRKDHRRHQVRCIVRAESE